MIFAHHPLGIGDRAVALIIEGQVELLAEAHRTDHRGELLGADTQAHRIEIDVAALHHCSVHVHRPVPLVAVESVISELEGAGAIDLLSTVDAGVEQSHRHRRLDRRARRVEALQRLVDERQMVVARQHLPLGLADPIGEIVGVERGHRGHGQDVAVGDVEDHDRAGLVADAARRILVEIGIDRELDRACR